MKARSGAPRGGSVRRAAAVWARRLRAAPVALLLAVATSQLVLVRTAALSPWAGGGFGMFSTADSPGRRHLHVWVVRPGVLREVLPPRAWQERALRAAVLPSRSRLASLGRDLAALPSPDAGAPEAVRIQVWRTRFDPRTLEPSGELVRALEIDLAGD